MNEPSMRWERALASSSSVGRSFSSIEFVSRVVSWSCPLVCTCDAVRATLRLRVSHPPPVRDGLRLRHARRVTLPPLQTLPLSEMEHFASQRGCADTLPSREMRSYASSAPRPGGPPLDPGSDPSNRHQVVTDKPAHTQYRAILRNSILIACMTVWGRSTLRP